MGDRDEEEYHYESDEFNDEDEDYEEEEEEEEPVDEGEKDDIDEETAAPEEGEVDAEAIDVEAELEEDTGPRREDAVINKINEQDHHHRIIKIVPPDERVTSNIIQWTEMVEAIGQRISQIEQGAPIFTDVTGLNNPIDMAKKEFVDRMSPLILVRPLRKDPDIWVVEKWKVREMTFPITVREISKITERQAVEALKGSSVLFEAETPLKKASKPEKTEKPEKASKAAKVTKPEKPAKAEKSEKKPAKKAAEKSPPRDKSPVKGKKK